MAQTKPSRALADWLERERVKRRWTVAEMGRRLREAADAIAMPGIPQARVLMSYVSRWEWGYCHVSERYRLLYCAAFGIGPANFGPPGFKKPSTAVPDIFIFHAHPPGTGVGKECGFKPSHPAGQDVEGQLPLGDQDALLASVSSSVRVACSP